MMRLAATLAADGSASIAVATVDHGLRTGARREAEAAGYAARELGLAHEILDWSGAKPSSGLQAAARGARYGLLVRQAQRVGAEAILTAHTADDQAETLLMRLARGSGPRGLSAMAKTSLIAAGASAPVSLLRPLLGVRRAALRDFLAAAKAAYIDDPSNEDLSFERVRVRKMLAGFEASGALTVEALTETADQMRAAATRIEEIEIDRFSALGGAFDAWGGASLAAAGPSDAALVARLLAAVAGEGYAPAPPRAAQALEAAHSARAATLGGVIIARRGDRLTFTREPAAVLGREGVVALRPVTIAPAERALYDGRFIVQNPFDLPAVLRPLNREEASAFGDQAEGGPALEIGGEIVAIPGESEAFAPLAAERFYLRVNRFP